MGVTTTSQDLIEELTQRRAKNMAFFRQAYPRVYKTYENYKFKRIKLNIDTEKGDVDILLDGKSLYPEGATKHAQVENEQFRSIYSEGKTLFTLRPCFAQDFTLKRQFHRSMAELLEQSPLSAETSGRGRYTMEEFYPLIVFCGVGSGVHINEFLRNNNVQNIVIAETDLDYFAASLYTIDWQEIYLSHTEKEGKSFDILLGNLDREEHIFSMIWNKIIQFCPIFPIATIFYNHLANPKYAKPIDKICQEIRLFIQIFGFYDDELNQLNNCLHNLNSGIPKIPPYTHNTISKPVCLVGGGPSVDERINDLIEVRDSVTIISCGTGIRTLYKNGVKPDIHVELESHLITLEHLENSAPREWLADIKFIGASQVSPFVFDLFNDKRIYFKSESSTSHMFGSADENIQQGTPTCTNAATALVSQHKCESIYFFGMDFGFIDQSKHHSKHSIFHSNDAPDRWKISSKNQSKSKTFEVESVSGGKIQTTDILFHGRRKVETIIALNPDNRYFNCSDGANISGTQWLDNSNFIKAVKNQSGKGIEEILFSQKNKKTIDQNTVRKKLKNIEEAIDFLATSSKSILDNEIKDMETLSQAIFKINRLIEVAIPKNYPESYYFIRGSVWHLMFSMYSHAFDLKEGQSRVEWISIIKKSIPDILLNLKKHYIEITSRELNRDDPWLKVILNDPEPS